MLIAREEAIYCRLKFHLYYRNIVPHPTSSLSLVIARFACFDPVKPPRVKCYDSLSLAR